MSPENSRMFYRPVREHTTACCIPFYMPVHPCAFLDTLACIYRYLFLCAPTWPHVLVYLVRCTCNTYVHTLQDVPRIPIHQSRFSSTYRRRPGYHYTRLRISARPHISRCLSGRFRDPLLITTQNTTITCVQSFSVPGAEQLQKFLSLGP